MKKRLASACFLVIFALLPRAAKASSVLASSFGYNTTDATVAFKAAIQSANDTILVDSIGTGLGVWLVGPCTFNDLQNRVIIFQPGVKLTAKSGAFPNTNDCLFRLVRALNVSVWGYGATFQMQKAEYTSGQWRHALALANSTNVDVHGLLLKDSGGDGIFITGAAWGGSQLYCDSVFIEDCVCDNNLRQGMSVTSAQNLTVENCTFKNTIGHLPEAGLDLEPDIPTQRMVNVTFSDCLFTGNHGDGIRLVFFWLNASSLPVSVVFENCTISDNYDPSNTSDAAEIFAAAYCTNFVTGEVTFNDCTVENSQWSAVNIRKPAASFLLTFNDCDFTNVSQTQQSDNNPVFVEICDYVNPTDWFGGIVLNNVCIDFPSNLPWFYAKGWSTSPGLGNVTATAGVTNPYQLPPVFSNVTSQQNVSINWMQGCCTSNLSVNEVPIPSGTYLANVLLTSAGTVANGSNVIFSTGNSVELQALFEVQLGGVFEVLLLGCFP